jgi:hypothetical protein
MLCKWWKDPDFESASEARRDFEESLRKDEIRWCEHKFAKREIKYGKFQTLQEHQLNLNWKEITMETLEINEDFSKLDSIYALQNIRRMKYQATNTTPGVIFKNNISKNILIHI